MHAYLAELEIQERKNERISMVITTVIMILLILFSLVWKAYRQRVPPPGEEYEVLGAIDFGDYSNGSRQVNNFEPPTENPAETPQSESAPEPEPQVETSEPVSAPEPVETQPDPSPVTVNDAPDPKPEPVKPKPEPEKPKVEEPKVEKPKENSTSKPSETPAEKPSTTKPGSNQGTAESGTGNQGTPDIKTLDPNGLYSFGTGTGGGLNGRRPERLGDPIYNSQEEGEVEFKFVIAPNGSVVFANTVGPTTKLSLKQAGIAAIKKWKFSPLPPGQSGNQTVRVTIKFKLK